MNDKTLHIDPSVNGVEKLIFESVNIRFEKEKETDVFSHKNNKTLAETLKHKRYSKFKDRIDLEYSTCLEMPLGKFLLDRKRSGDSFYTNFLNKYGDLAYSKFWIDDEHFLNQRGIYAYFVNDDLKYFGRCKDTLKKRVNQGYGKIHPKNCYIDGQATNCRINALISLSAEGVSFWFCAMKSLELIETLERHLIHQYSPSWNIQKS